MPIVAMVSRTAASNIRSARVMAAAPQTAYPAAIILTTTDWTSHAGAF
jgi:hypothetical protein